MTNRWAAAWWGVGIACLVLACATAWAVPVRAHGEGANAEALAAPPGAVAVPRVRVRWVRVMAPLDDEDGPRGRAFFDSPGTSVGVRIDMPGGIIVSLAEEDIQIDAFTDDFGQSMLRVNEPNDRAALRRRPGQFGLSYPPSARTTVEFHAPGLPSAGAGRLRLEGSVAFEHAGRLDHHRVKGLLLREGETFLAGPFQGSVTRVVPSGEAETDQLVTIELEQGGIMLTSVEVRDMDGAPVAQRTTGQSASVSNAEARITRTVQIPAELREITLVLRAWGDVRKVRVPIRLEIDLGAPARDFPRRDEHPAG